MSVEDIEGFVHARSVRPKRRRKIPNGTAKADAVAEVFAKCGHWVPKSIAVRVDTARGRARVTCPACLAALGIRHAG